MLLEVALARVFGSTTRSTQRGRSARDGVQSGPATKASIAAAGKYEEASSRTSPRDSRSSVVFWSCMIISARLILSSERHGGSMWTRCRHFSGAFPSRQREQTRSTL